MFWIRFHGAGSHIRKKWKVTLQSAWLLPTKDLSRICPELLRSSTAYKEELIPTMSSQFCNDFTTSGHYTLGEKNYKNKWKGISIDSQTSRFAPG